MIAHVDVLVAALLESAVLDSSRSERRHADVTGGPVRFRFGRRPAVVTRAGSNVTRAIALAGAGSPVLSRVPHCDYDGARARSHRELARADVVPMHPYAMGPAEWRFCWSSQAGTSD
jgi:hypothetical protein